MSFEESLVVETRRMSREFAIYGAVVGFIAGALAAVILQAVFQ
ncbi:hypothetical protein [Stenotrophomonas sp.]|nr:hypothetical protein [Stenotrophomonas sp.]